MKRLVDRNAKGYVEKNDITTPDINAEPWILPLITLKLIASDSTEIENLLYTWELDAFDETLLDIQINFFKPNKISQSLNPEKLFVELRIQQF